MNPTIGDCNRFSRRKYHPQSINLPPRKKKHKPNKNNNFFPYTEYGIETPSGDLKDLSNLSISNLRTTNPNIATTSTATNPSYAHKSTNDNNYCLYKYNEFNECNHLMHNNSKLNGKNNHVVQKNTFFKSLTRSSSFCRIKVNSKKFRNISLKFRKSDKVCCTPDYTATASATSSQVRGKFEPFIHPSPQNTIKIETREARKKTREKAFQLSNAIKPKCLSIVWSSIVISMSKANHSG